MKIVSAALAVLALSLGTAQAQGYPTHPVRIVVPFGPGGGAAVVAQVLGAELGRNWGQQPIIDFRPGAGGNIGAEIAAQAPADGYTLLLSTQSFAVNDALTPSSIFKPEASFEPVTLLGKSENVILAPTSLAPASVAELVKLSKQPGTHLNYASTGNGTIGHLATELFKSKTGLIATHVPYRSISQTTTDIIAGRVDLWITSITGKTEYVTSGKMKALGVSGSARSPLLPNVPTLDEVGVHGYSAASWYAVWAPRGTPAEILAKLSKDFNAAINSPSVKKQFDLLGVEAIGGSRGELRTFLHEELAKWRNLVSAAAITSN